MRTGALKMTRLAIIFSLLFVTPAWAAETIMRCIMPSGSNLIFKYEKSYYGEETCYQRFEGTWLNLKEPPLEYTVKDGICRNGFDIIDFTVGERTVYWSGERDVGSCSFLKN